MPSQDTSHTGATITLYLVDGVHGGIRIISRANWSGVGVDCSRKDLTRAIRRQEEFSGVGVYLLRDFDEQGEGLPDIYVGEAENLGNRLSSHAAKRDFGWQRLVIFTSSDSSLNKAHAKYLEAHLCRLAKAAKRSTLRNKTLPTPPRLSDPDQNRAEAFLREMLLALPVIGVSEFQSPGVTVTPTEAKFVESPEVAVTPTEDKFELVHRRSSAHAYGVETADDGFKVFEGATTRAGDADRYTNAKTQQLRRELCENGVLVPDGDGLRLTQDRVFDSSSSAASVLTGYKVNGPNEWRRLSDGKSLKEVQRSR